MNPEKRVVLRTKAIERPLSDSWYGGDVPVGLTADDVYELLAEDPIATMEELTGPAWGKGGWLALLRALIEVDVR